MKRLVTERKTTYEVLSGTASEIEDTLESYESTKDAHSLRVLAMTTVDATNFQVLVRYVEVTET